MTLIFKITLKSSKITSKSDQNYAKNRNEAPSVP